MTHSDENVEAGKGMQNLGAWCFAQQQASEKVFLGENFFFMPHHPLGN